MYVFTDYASPFEYAPATSSRQRPDVGGLSTNNRHASLFVRKGVFFFCCIMPYKTPHTRVHGWYNIMCVCVHIHYREPVERGKLPVNGSLEYGTRTKQDFHPVREPRKPDLNGIRSRFSSQ